MCSLLWLWLFDKFFLFWDSKLIMILELSESGPQHNREYNEIPVAINKMHYCMFSFVLFVLITSEIWEQFGLVAEQLTTEGEKVTIVFGFAACPNRNAVYVYDSHHTGTKTLSSHMESCKPPNRNAVGSLNIQRAL